MASRKITFQNRLDWLQARRQILTASDVAAVLGMDSRRSPFSVWAEKVELAGKEPPAELDLDDPKLEYIRWGAILEEPIAKEVGRRLEREMIDHGRFTLFVNDELPIPLGATPDREISDVIHPGDGAETPAWRDRRGPGAAEIKTFGTFADPAGEWNDEGPVKHIVQLQVQLTVTTWRWGLVAGLGGGQRLKIHEHERDDEFIAWMLGKLEVFWKRVREKDPPPVDGSESTATALSTLFRGGGVAIELPASARLWHEQWYEARQIKAAAESDELEAANAIKLAMGDAEEALLPGEAAEGLRQGFRWKRIAPRAEKCDGCGHETPVNAYRRFTGFVAKDPPAGLN